MRRRDFIKGMAGSAAAVWPLAARAQQAGQMPRIGVLTGLDEAEATRRIGPFLQELQRLGWIDGRNIRIDKRVGAGKADTMRKYAGELAALAPDAILAVGSSSTEFSIQATSTVPIVFTLVTDPLGAGFVENLSHPGGNVTGFMLFEYSLSGKWLELLKQVAPNLKRVAVIRDPSIGAGTGQFAVVQAVAPSLNLEVSAINVRDPIAIERAVVSFASSPNGGLIVTAGPLAAIHRDLIIALAAREKLPAIYFERVFAAAGGLISYGPSFDDAGRQAAGYVDRILKGEKPGNLPVQAPIKYELVINLKTAKAMGLTIRQSLLATADEVIE